MYRKPYLKIPIVPPYPREEIIPLEIKVLTEVQTMKIFMVPTLKDPLPDWLELSLVSPSGENRRLLLFSAQCEWEGKNYPGEYVSMLRKCRYYLRLKIKEPPADLPSGTTLILAPCSEFGGLLLTFYKAGFLITLFMLFVCYLIFATTTSSILSASASQRKNSDSEESEIRKE